MTTVARSSKKECHVVISTGRIKKWLFDEGHVIVAHGIVFGDIGSASLISADQPRKSCILTEKTCNAAVVEELFFGA